MLSVVVPVLRPSARLAPALADVAAALRAIAVTAEVILAGRQLSTTIPSTGDPTCLVVEPYGDGYGNALQAGFAAASGQYIVTIDHECGGVAEAIAALWEARDRGAVVVGSRYVDGAVPHMSLSRRLGSLAVNSAFGRGLSVPVFDLSSAFRLYRADVLRQLRVSGRHYDLLPEILVRALASGWAVHEVPLRLAVRGGRGAATQLLQLLGAYSRMFGRLWQLRNSIEAADYDARAYDSIIPLQRYWQRRRHHHVTELIRNQGPVLDVGCGSSHIIAALPPGSVAVDILANKLRYARRFSRRLVRASAFQLPFADASFPCVLCSQVIEHVPAESPILDELVRVLAPGGRLVLGTPDYAQWQWVYMEKAYGFFKPGGYADEHITHYTRAGLLQHFERLGFQHEATRYIMRGELILAFRKSAS